MGEQLVICRLCNNKIAASNLKFDEKTRQLVCSSCYHALKKQNANVDISNKHTMQSRKNPEMDKYVCTKCNYKFTRKKGTVIDKCPYCGANAVEKDTPLLANQILEEATDKRYEF